VLRVGLSPATPWKEKEKENLVAVERSGNSHTKKRRRRKNGKATPNKESPDFRTHDGNHPLPPTRRRP